eukprot:CAMPEP_0119279770 /NCGR_PEP_ID=MMETSP1329-20130426/21432_1 /TAXON_ID=114041 /ORGANISM="Genus nov. species nov., Strain RCC1024" /LENGTH=83 /DNA_ID=CAMNT_0007280331 /DNA_START=228 /DNA_END=479 /DNA_ORIENTATION=-
MTTDTNGAYVQVRRLGGPRRRRGLEAVVSRLRRADDVAASAVGARALATLLLLVAAAGALLRRLSKKPSRRARAVISHSHVPA